MAALRTVKLPPILITWLFRKTCTTLRSGGCVAILILSLPTYCPHGLILILILILIPISFPPLLPSSSSSHKSRVERKALEILFHALTQCQRWHRLAAFTFMAATPVQLAQANHHVALATCHPPYPTPSSATRNWVRFACVICYEMLRFGAFLKFWEADFRHKFLMEIWLWLFVSRRSFRRQSTQPHENKGVAS